MAKSSRDEWVKRVERWVDSGLTSKEFGAEVGVNPRTLVYWKWRLKKEAGASRRKPSSPRPVARKEAARKAPKPRATFVEVAPEPRRRPASALEVVVAEGLVVRVPVGFDDETLGRVVRVLGARA